jgi:hypothetical protein
MKIRILALLLLSLAFFSPRAFSAELGMVRMGIVQGDVQIHTEDTQDWVPAAVNTPLAQGDRVWVPEGGRTELQVLGGLFIRLDNFTSLDILSLGDNSGQFFINVGRAYINNSTSGIDQLQFDTPVSSVSCDNTSTIMIDVEENGATEISVLQGSADVETRNGRVRIPSGNTYRIGEDLGTGIYSLNSPDEWEQWNRELDRRISESGTSLRYLPEELDEYSYDFDANGSWINDANYGYVWSPSVSFSLDWAPYHNGRWVWIGGNYVWISSERWGWAPYHYGRWVFRQHGGWCWVPPRRGAVYWGPGYVGWVYTPNYVSWIPLAPGEIYYGHGYYGPGSVNINTLPSSNFTIKRNYLNRNARNAIRVEHRDTFLHGRRIAVPATENPFNQRNVGIGPPRFKPGKETYSPTLRKIPSAKLPPRKIRTISPEILRKERKLAPGKRGSVFTPGSPVRELPTPPRETPKRILPKQRPEIYSDGLQNREGGQPLKKDQLRRELPVQEKKPATIFTPSTPKRTRKEATPTGSQPQRQPATIRVAPQPVAPQPVAPTPVWTPTKPQLPEKGRSPAPQLPKRAPAPTMKRTIPTAPQGQGAASPSRQLQRSPLPVRPGSQTIRQTIPSTPQGQGAASPARQLQRSPLPVRQGSQIIQLKKPATVQPKVNQSPVTPGSATTTTPESRQQRGQKVEKPSFQRGNRQGENR